jgi:hypothetical protein
LPGSGWEKHLKEIDEKTYVGSQFHYESGTPPEGYTQTDVPNINSECGNVWGYEGSTGDVDWSWDYHRMINTFRKYPKIAGWLYTEHHDVINEWNGYFRFDRSEKETGVGELVDGMSIKDFHSDIYISAGNEISRSVKPKEEITLPLYLSVMTDKDLGKNLNLKVQMYGYDALGQKKTWGNMTKTVPYQAWIQKELEPIKLTMPDEKSVVIAALILEDNAGNVVHRNFTTFIVEGKTPSEMTLLSGKKAKLISIEPKNFSDARWSKKQWNILDGLKVNGAGSGYFEYKIKIPTDTKFESASFVAEVSSKQLFAKDKENSQIKNTDYMLGAKAEPSQNKNAYPMTDTSRYPSAVSVKINGIFAGRYDLSNDPADHRGILSWHNQPQDKKLYEAGSYGYRLGVNIPQKSLELARSTGELIIRLEVDESLAGGLAIYGDKFGRYPINPTVILVTPNTPNP